MAKSIDKSSIKANSQSFYGKRVSHSIYFEPTNDEEIVNILKQLNPNKAPGYDDIRRWSLRGRPWPRGHILQSLALASKVKSLALPSSCRKLPYPRLEDSTIF